MNKINYNIKKFLFNFFKEFLVNYTYSFGKSCEKYDVKRVDFVKIVKSYEITSSMSKAYKECYFEKDFDKRFLILLYKDIHKSLMKKISKDLEKYLVVEIQNPSLNHGEIVTYKLFVGNVENNDNSDYFNKLSDTNGT